MIDIVPQSNNNIEEEDYSEFIVDSSAIEVDQPM